MVRKYKWLFIAIALEAAVLILLLISYVVKKGNTVVYSPGLEDWKSDVLSYDDGWHMTGEGSVGEGDAAEILYGPYIQVPKGDYTLRISYECDSDQAFRVFSEDQGGTIYPQSEERLYSGKTSADCDYYIDGAVSSLEVRISYDGAGEFHIHDISLVSGCWRPLENILIFSLLFIITDILLLIYKALRSEKMKCAALALLSSLALLIDPQYTEGFSLKEQIGGMFNNNRWLPVLLLCLFFLFYSFSRSRTGLLLADTGTRICIVILSVLLPLSIVIGYSFQKTDSWDLVFGPHLQIVKSYMAFSGLAVICYYAAAMLYAWLDDIKPGTEGKCGGILGAYLKCFRAHPFLIPFITLFLFALPYMILSYPALFVLGDSDNQIAQAFNVPLYGEHDMERLAEGLTLINQHHPVAHTLLMHVFLLIGLNIVHSANIGLFMMAFFQAAVTLAAVSYLIATIAKENASDRQLLLLTGFFCICPCIKNYLFLMSKDVLYGTLTLVSIILLWKLITGRQCNKRTAVWYVLCLLGILVMRNEGIYIIILQMIIYLIMIKRLRRLWVGSLITAGAVFLLLTRIVFPLNGFESTEINEMLSIPIMQTARVMCFYPGEISAEERSAIDGMWDYEELSENYGFDISDTSKGTYRSEADGEDVKRYFMAWGRMGLRYPGEYIQATINNYFNYFFPGERQASMISYRAGTETMERLNEAFSKAGIEGMDPHYPGRLTRFRGAYESLRNTIFAMPFASLLISVGFYTWVLLVFFFYWIRKRNAEAVALFIPLVLILLVCLAGPCNGEYFRYYYPIVLCLPASMSLAWVIRGDLTR